MRVNRMKSEVLSVMRAFHDAAEVRGGLENVFACFSLITRPKRAGSSQTALGASFKRAYAEIVVQLQHCNRLAAPLLRDVYAAWRRSGVLLFAAAQSPFTGKAGPTLCRWSTPSRSPYCQPSGCACLTRSASRPLPLFYRRDWRSSGHPTPTFLRPTPSWSTSVPRCGCCSVSSTSGAAKEKWGGGVCSLTRQNQHDARGVLAVRGEPASGHGVDAVASDARGKHGCVSPSGALGA